MISLSLKDIKTLLTIESTQYDDYIEKMLPVTIDLVEKYCKTEFVLRNEDGTYKKNNEGYMLTEIGLMIVIAKIIQFYLTNSAVSYEAVGRVTTTYNTDLPKSIYEAMKPYKKGGIKFL